jgi:hypothetical protein
MSDQQANVLILACALIILVICVVFGTIYHPGARPVRPLARMHPRAEAADYQWLFRSTKGTLSKSE